MKISRRMQRQVEIIIRHAQAQEITQTGVLPVVATRDPQNEKAREANGTGHRWADWRQPSTSK
jgi:hypothetical protein